MADRVVDEFVKRGIEVAVEEIELGRGKTGGQAHSSSFVFLNRITVRIPETQNCGTGKKE